MRQWNQTILGYGALYSTRYRKAKETKGLTGSFGDRSWVPDIRLIEYEISFKLRPV